MKRCVGRLERVEKSSGVMCDRRRKGKAYKMVVRPAVFGLETELESDQYECMSDVWGIKSERPD